VVARANIPNLWSELDFINEFANESLSKGMYGYCFATLQIVVETLTNFTNKNSTDNTSNVSGQTQNGETTERDPNIKM
jgi:hypothetical protein